MISKVLKEHMPEWIEAGSIIGSVMIMVIAAAAISLYKIDLMQRDVTSIKTDMAIVPVLATDVKNINSRVLSIENDIDDITKDVSAIKVDNARHHGAYTDHE